jgi:hypothetical protein
MSELNCFFTVLKIYTFTMLLIFKIHDYETNKIMSESHCVFHLSCPIEKITYF